MKYSDYLVIAIVVLQGILAGVISAEPGELGLPVIVVKWLAIANVGVVLLMNQLKALGAAPSASKDPPRA